MGTARWLVPLALLALPAHAAAQGHLGTSTVDSSVAPGFTNALTSPTVPSSAHVMKVTTLTDGDGLGNLRTAIATLPSKRDRLLFCIGLYGAFRDVRDPQTNRHDELALLAMQACLSLAFPKTGPPPARAAARRCPAPAANLPMKLTRSGGVWSMTVGGKPKRVKRGPLVVTCRRTGRSMTMTLRPRSRKRSLRSVIGPKLALGLRNDGTQTENVRTTFTTKK